MMGGEGWIRFLWGFAAAFEVSRGNVGRVEKRCGVEATWREAKYA